MRKKVTLFIGLIFLFGAAMTVQAQDAEYIGAAKCKMCHNKEATGAQYTKWQSTRHAKAFETLAGDKAKEIATSKGIADPQKDQKCLKCHSTAAAVNADLVATLTKEEGVSCESCHGPGSAYKTATVMKDKAKALAAGMIEPKKEVCVKCHNAESPTFKSFDYDTFVKKIAHPVPAQ